MKARGVVTILAIAAFAAGTLVGCSINGNARTNRVEPTVSTASMAESGDVTDARGPTSVQNFRNARRSQPRIVTSGSPSGDQGFGEAGGVVFVGAGAAGAVVAGAGDAGAVVVGAGDAGAVVAGAVVAEPSSRVRES